MNVVSELDWLAVLCIWSRAWASCSLSAIELAAIEFMELRRFRKLFGDPRLPGAGEAAAFDVALLDIVGGEHRYRAEVSRSVGGLFAPAL